MAIGLLQAFELIHTYGKRAIDAKIITHDDILFSAAAWTRKGCKIVSSKLTRADIDRVIDMGKRIKAWKDEGMK